MGVTLLHIFFGTCSIGNHISANHINHVEKRGRNNNKKSWSPGKVRVKGDRNKRKKRNKSSCGMNLELLWVFRQVGPKKNIWDRLGVQG